MVNFTKIQQSAQANLSKEANEEYTKDNIEEGFEIVIFDAVSKRLKDKTKFLNHEKIQIKLL